MTDPKDAGEKEGWFSADHDDHAWPEVRIDQWWELQGHSYDGAAWYRVWVDVPESARGQKIELVFGAVDESAWVWVNGAKAGEHDEGEAGWDKRFSLDVTHALRPGARNLIAVKVLDRASFGGIWRSAKLLAPRP
jgi:beta-galactosidase/beta-glucuronidase